MPGLSWNLPVYQPNDTPPGGALAVAGPGEGAIVGDGGIHRANPRPNAEGDSAIRIGTTGGTRPRGSRLRTTDCRDRRLLVATFRICLEKSRRSCLHVDCASQDGEIALVVPS